MNNSPHFHHANNIYNARLWLHHVFSIYTKKYDRYDDAVQNYGRIHVENHSEKNYYLSNDIAYNDGNGNGNTHRYIKHHRAYFTRE